MTIIVNVLGNECIQSDTYNNLTAENITAGNILYVCDQFAREHCVRPEEIFVIASGKLIEIDLESVLQSELEKQLQEKTI